MPSFDFCDVHSGVTLALGNLNPHKPPVVLGGYTARNPDLAIIDGCLVFGGIGHMPFAR